jgi:predicted  nucleic acid-binding Zn-ribbon protein
MQSLRSRLTLAEAKLVEKDVELTGVKEENVRMKESLEKISEQQQSAFAKSDSESSFARFGESTYISAVKF